MKNSDEQSSGWKKMWRTEWEGSEEWSGENQDEVEMFEADFSKKKKFFCENFLGFTKFGVRRSKQLVRTTKQWQYSKKKIFFDKL